MKRWVEFLLKMAYEDFKFFIPEEKTVEEQLEQLKNEIFAMEANYAKLDSVEDSMDKEIAEAQILAKRQEYEDLGGTYE